MTNIYSYKGLPLSIFIDLDNDDGSTYDASLFTYDGEIRSHVDASLYGTLTVVGGNDSNGDSGVQVTLSAANSALIAVGIYKYDILQTEVATGLVTPIIFGDFVQGATSTAP